MTWRPLLEGALADRGWAALRAIANSVAAYDTPADDLALFWSYVAPALGDDYDGHHEAAMVGLAAAIERGVPKPGLYDGLAGLAWTAAHCAEGADAYLDLVDKQLVELLTPDAWPGHFDLISGLTGVGLYFLDRGDAALARAGLDAVVGHLASAAERRADRVTWHTRLELVPAHEHARYPTGWYNCGVAHGVPGVIGLLGRIAELPGAAPVVAELRDGAIRWMFDQRTPDLTRSRFPTVATPDQELSARTAWCYGDLGVAAVIWDAQARAGASTAEIQQIALAAVQRPFDQTGVVDAMLCHGAAGLGHIANRFAHATGEVAFRSAALVWFERALDSAEPGNGIGGFTIPGYDFVTKKHGRQTAVDFLDGAIGLGLALAGALTPLEPSWDRLLLCDLRSS